MKLSEGLRLLVDGVVSSDTPSRNKGFVLSEACLTAEIVETVRATAEEHSKGVKCDASCIGAVAHRCIANRTWNEPHPTINYGTLCAYPAERASALLKAAGLGVEKK